MTGISSLRSASVGAWSESASRIGSSTSSTNRRRPGSQPTVEIVVRRCVTPSSGRRARRFEHGVEVHHRLAHAHEDDVVDRLDAAEVERLVEDLAAVRLRPNRIWPVAQNVHVSGQPDCDETQTERRPSR